MLSSAIRDKKESLIEFYGKMKASMYIILNLPKANLTLLLYGVELLDIEKDMDGILLGSTFLKRIGSDFDQHLARVR